MEAKILLIDDEEDDRFLIEKVLLDSGCVKNIMKARSGEEGIEMIKEDSPDIVILDTVLPGDDGFETCKKIKKINDKIKVIIFTGVIDAVDASKAREYGADDYCVKTSDNAQILFTVKNLLDDNRE